MTIPASVVAKVIPGVVSAGGSALVLNGVMLTSNTRVPIGTMTPFSSLAAVQAYFGPTSTEAALAANYFSGFQNSTLQPGLLYFYQYCWTSAVSAYLRGVSVAALTLTQLQAISGTLIVTIDGTVKTASSLNLSAATSFTNAAQLIQNALAITGATDGVQTGSIATTGVMTTTALTSGQFSVGDLVGGGTTPAGTYITAILTGTGGVGTYQVAPAPGTAVASATLTASKPAVAYDSISGAFVITSGTTGTASTMSLASGTTAAALGLGTGGTLSQGAPISTPAAAMTAISAITQNWAAFMTVFEPVLADKLSFAGWVNGQNNRFAYIAWDSDANESVANNTTALGPMLIANQSTGTCVIAGDPAQAASLGVSLASLVQPVAAFILGAIASINFGQTNGRITFAFKSQAGLIATCANQTTAAILNANGANYYGAFATANQGFVFFYNGQVSGLFAFLDEYVNQIWLNAQLQLALISLMTQVTSIPYNQQGYGLITAACLGPIQQALNFGAIRAGVTLSTAEAAEVNYAAGLPIAQALSANGWYLQVLDPGAQARSTRSTPSISLWYMDGGSVHQITLASVDVQ